MHIFLIYANDNLSFISIFSHVSLYTAWRVLSPAFCMHMVCSFICVHHPLPVMFQIPTTTNTGMDTLQSPYRPREIGVWGHIYFQDTLGRYSEPVNSPLTVPPGDWEGPWVYFRDQRGPLRGGRLGGQLGPNRALSRTECIPLGSKRMAGTPFLRTAWRRTGSARSTHTSIL